MRENVKTQICMRIVKFLVVTVDKLNQVVLADVRNANQFFSRSSSSSKRHSAINIEYTNALLNTQSNFSAFPSLLRFQQVRENDNASVRTFMTVILVKNAGLHYVMHGYNASNNQRGTAAT